FAGVIDEVAFYNAALSAAAVAAHYAAGSVGAADPTVNFIDPAAGAVVAGTVPVEVGATDPQDSPGALAVTISTDGGTTFAPAGYDTGSQTHSIEWDTTGVPDGAAVLVANVVDTDGNLASSTIRVSVRNNPGGSIYRDAVLADGPAVYYRLGEAGGSTARDEMGAVDATYVGSPALGGAGLVVDGDTAVSLAGGDFIAVPDSSLINRSSYSQRTVEAWFRADGVASRQVVYEEGAGTRGLSIYVDGGSVYMGAWNLAGQSWGPIFVSAPVSAGEIYHVAFVLGGGVVEGFVNGASVGSQSGAGTLNNHTADTGIGAMNDSTNFHDGKVGGEGFYFDGVIDEVAIYNSALSAGAIAAHFEAGAPGGDPTDPTVAFVVPADGATVGGVVTVELLASDPQDAAADLGVEVSVGGGPFTVAAFNAGSGRHEWDWDTASGSDGAVALVANVTDLDANTASASIDVTVNNAPPGAYLDAVLASGPDVYWRLGETSGAVAVDIVSGVDGSYSGGPSLGGPGLVTDADAAPEFDGIDDYVAVPNSGLINLGVHTLRTISLWMRADDVVSRQVLFEEGGGTRGMSIYVDQGRVYMGAWNSADDSSADTPWVPAFLSAPIAAGSVYNVILVLDQPTARLEGYVNGASIGTAVGGTLHAHGARVGIGAVDNGVVFHDGKSGVANGYFFDGVIDEVAIYNSVLDATVLTDLYLTGSSSATDPSAVFIVPAIGSIVSDTVTIEVAAADPQDAAIDLTVDVSTDGGSSFSPASFNPATLHHDLTWDTTLAADGGTALIARVTDSDGNTTNSAISVTVSNVGATAMIIAAGDISTCQNTNDSDTADLIDSIIANTSLPVTVVPVGDLVYEQGTIEDFNDCYDPTWGRHNAIAKPVVGNHEYNTLDAAGYDAYFGAPAHGPDFYYRYELAGWEIYALNSNCGWIGGCDETAAQLQWLRSELATSTNSCTMGFFHHPRFVSETPLNNPLEFWKALNEFGGDVIVNGHAHLYAEALPQDWQGNLDLANGIRQFISGAGGRSHYDLPPDPHPNLDVSNTTDYGVLVLELATGGYTWHFINVDGVELFSGSASCN
ncbi:LamG-like jellyroll fold domain-containing protein, partial [Actinomycetota bacterium]